MNKEHMNLVNRETLELNYDVDNMVNIKYPKETINISNQDVRFFRTLVNIYFKTLIPKYYLPTLKAAIYHSQLTTVINFEIKDLNFSFRFYPIDNTFRLSAFNNQLQVSLYTTTDAPKIEILPMCELK